MDGRARESNSGTHTHAWCTQRRHTHERAGKSARTGAAQATIGHASARTGAARVPIKRTSAHTGAARAREGARDGDDASAHTSATWTADTLNAQKFTTLMQPHQPHHRTRLGTRSGDGKAEEQHLRQERGSRCRKSDTRFTRLTPAGSNNANNERAREQWIGQMEPGGFELPRALGKAGRERKRKKHAGRE